MHCQISIGVVRGHSGSFFTPLGKSSSPHFHILIYPEGREIFFLNKEILASEAISKHFLDEKNHL